MIVLVFLPFAYHTIVWNNLSNIEIIYQIYQIIYQIKFTIFIVIYIRMSECSLALRTENIFNVKYNFDVISITIFSSRV